jgi:BON domain
MAKNGHVMLTGAVRCGAERAAAEALIADLTGIRTVTNDIQIRDDADPFHRTQEPVEQPVGRAPDGFTRYRRPG